MEIIRETDYAIRCVYYLSKHPENVTMVDEIAREMSIPKSFLAKILQKLTKANIVKSFRGVKGGFQLSKRPCEIDLLNVIETIQGPIIVNKCVVDKKVCSRSGRCSMHPLWKIISECLESKLRDYTFEWLLLNDDRAALTGHR